MPDPNWTSQYNFSTTPENNGFTRVLHGSPDINLVMTGQTANRRIEIDSTSGSAVFLLSNVPSLNITQGATVESLVSVNGAGDAGYELTFQGTFFGVQVYQNKITIVVNDGNGPQEFVTDSNATDTIVRATVSPSSILNVYRNGVLIATKAMPASSSQLPRVLFWGEDGGIQTFKSLKFYIGGPVAP